MRNLRELIKLMDLQRVIFPSDLQQQVVNKNMAQIQAFMGNPGKSKTGLVGRPINPPRRGKRHGKYVRALKRNHFSNSSILVHFFYIFLAEPVLTKSSENKPKDAQTARNNATEEQNKDGKYDRVPLSVVRTYMFTTSTVFFYL
jgi:hypothetical protein